MCKLIPFAACALLMVISAGSVRGQCEPQWSDQFMGAWLNGPPSCFTEYDRDGSGPLPPVLIAAGSFRTANTTNDATLNIGTPVNHIAQWNGVHWSPFRAGLNSLSNYGSPITGLATLNSVVAGIQSQQLFVGGNFKIPGQSNATKVARWDDDHWTDISTGMLSGAVSGLTTYDPDGPGILPPRLVAYGALAIHYQPTTSPSLRIHPMPTNASCGLAQYYRGQWVPIPSISDYANYEDFPTPVAFDPDDAGPAKPLLCVARGMIAGHDANVVDAWNGKTWATIGAFDGAPRVLCVIDEDGDGPRTPRLFVAGLFNSVDGIPTARVAAWDGQTWAQVGTNPPLTTYYSEMIAYRIPGESHDSLFLESHGTLLYKWDGNNWVTLDNGFRSNGGPMVVFDEDGDGPAKPALIAPLSSPNGVGAYSKWAGGEWKPILGNGLSTFNSIAAYPAAYFLLPVQSDTEPSGNELIVGGFFLSAGDVPVNGLARFNGNTWNAIDNEWNQWPILGTILQDEGSPASESNLVIEGSLQQAPYGISIRREIDGNWTSIGDFDTTAGLYIRRMISFDQDGDGPLHASLVIAGELTPINGSPMHSVAQWDRGKWTSIGDSLGITHYITDLASFHDNTEPQSAPSLFACGSFILPDGDMTGFARWDGQYWKRAGHFGCVEGYAMLVGNAENNDPSVQYLYLAGTFRLPSGVDYRIARWDGQEWHILPAYRPLLNYISRLTIIDEDGPGPAPPTLIASSQSLYIGPQPPPSFIILTSGSWKPVYGLTGMEMYAMTSFDNDGPGPHPPSLFFGGEYLGVNGLASLGIARWGRPTPFLRKQPEPLTARRGESFCFSVHAGGAGPFSYQWRKNGVALVDDSRVTGSTTEALRIAGARHDDEAEYSVAVTGACSEVLSRSARLTVSPMTGPHNE